MWWLVESFSLVNLYRCMIMCTLCYYSLSEFVTKRCQQLLGKCTFCSYLYPQKMCVHITHPLTHNLRVECVCSSRFLRLRTTMFHVHFNHIPSSSWILSTLCIHHRTYPWVEVSWLLLFNTVCLHENLIMFRFFWNTIIPNKNILICIPLNIFCRG